MREVRSEPVARPRPAFGGLVVHETSTSVPSWTTRTTGHNLTALGVGPRTSAPVLDSEKARSTPKENLDESQPRNKHERWHQPRNGAIHPSDIKRTRDTGWVNARSTDSRGRATPARSSGSNMPNKPVQC